MSRLRTFQLILLLLALLSGCSSQPVLTSAKLPQGAAAHQQDLLPSLEPNPDLFKFLAPSNDRDWAADQAVLAFADFQGQQVTVHNIRRITYRTATDFSVEYRDQTYDLDRLESVDFIVVPFNATPDMAHTMLSFGFSDGQYLGVSVEIRKERGESFNPLKGFLRQYELMYVVADEQELILRRVLFDLCDVYVYRTRAKPAEARALFCDVMRRVNKLADRPEFYDTLTNNCTTNIRNHINRLAPDRVPYDYRVLLPGNSDKLAYDLGLLATDAPFAETRRAARVNYLAYFYRDDPEFSQRIRQQAAY
jgi:hypothetical protein